MLTAKTVAPPIARGRWSYATEVCLVAAIGGLLFGYDTAVINGSIGFLKIRFGLDAAMTGYAASSALIGCVIGVAIAGPASDRLGRKPVLMAAGTFFLLSAAGTALPRSIGAFILFRIVAGIGVGIASMASPLYIAEVAPARWRGRMVSLNQLAIVSGMLLIYFVNFFIARLGNADWQVSTSWRWMFASGIVPAGLFLLLLLRLPESPRWLAQQGRHREADSIRARIGVEVIDDDVKPKGPSAAKRPNPAVQPARPRSSLRIFALGLALAVLQQVTGINVFLYFGTEIFKKLGVSVDTALLETVAVGVINLIFTGVAIATVDRLGRRPLMILGAAGMGLCLAAIGWEAQKGATPVWDLALVLGYIACFAVSVGPVTWVILSEIFPTRLRGRGLAISSLGLWIANVAVAQTFPWLDENPALIARYHHALPFFIYAAMCVVLMIVTAAGVPETKGRSLEEIERYWSR